MDQDIAVSARNAFPMLEVESASYGSQFDPKKVENPPALCPPTSLLLAADVIPQTFNVTPAMAGFVQGRSLLLLSR